MPLDLYQAFLNCALTDPIKEEPCLGSHILFFCIHMALNRNTLSPNQLCSWFSRLHSSQCLKKIFISVSDWPRLAKTSDNYCGPVMFQGARNAQFRENHDFDILRIIGLTQSWLIQQIVKTISYYRNMQYQVTIMYQTGENRVCPKAARACSTPRT